MHCADNQGCELKCHASSRNPMCVGAKVVCGDGTVAQGFKCVPTDQSEDCFIEYVNPFLYSLYKYEIMASFYNVLSSCDYYSLTLCVFNNHNLNISHHF